MNILNRHRSTLRRFTRILQEFDVRCKAERKRLCDIIADTLQEQAIFMQQSSNDIGNPAEICEKLVAMQLEYTELVSQEKSERKDIMKRYNAELTADTRDHPQILKDLITKSIAKSITKSITKSIVAKIRKCHD